MFSHVILLLCAILLLLSRDERSEDFVSAEYRAEVGAHEEPQVDDIEAPPLAIQLVPLGVLAGLFVTWYYSKRAKRIKSGLHKKRDEDC